MSRGAARFFGQAMARRIVYDGGMRFSLFTLFVILTVLAIDIGICIRVPAYDPSYILWDSGIFVPRSPNLGEVAVRVAWSGPLAVIGVLGILWLIRTGRADDSFHPTH